MGFATHDLLNFCLNSLKNTLPLKLLLFFVMYAFIQVGYHIRCLSFSRWSMRYNWHTSSGKIRYKYKCSVSRMSISPILFWHFTPGNVRSGGEEKKRESRKSANAPENARSSCHQISVSPFYSTKYFFSCTFLSRGRNLYKIFFKLVMATQTDFTKCDELEMSYK